MFKKASRKQAKLKLALTGPSGSGKTMSALEIATGLGGKIAVIDTENGSASLYAEQYDFDVLEIGAPYTTEKYIKAIEEAAQSGYDCLIIDSISHSWSGVGGLLEQKERLDAHGGNSFTNWAAITPKHEYFKSAILAVPMHTITTMRSKQDYVMEKNDRGKQAPRKVGLAPIQRDGIEYEFTVVLDMAMDNHASASKDRTGLFYDQIFQPNVDTGKALLEWLSKGEEAPAAQVAPPAVEVPKSVLQARKLYQELKEDYPSEVEKIGDAITGKSDNQRLKILRKFKKDLARHQSEETPAASEQGTATPPAADPTPPEDQWNPESIVAAYALLRARVNGVSADSAEAQEFYAVGKKSKPDVVLKRVEEWIRMTGAKMNKHTGEILSTAGA